MNVRTAFIVQDSVRGGGTPFMGDVNGANPPYRRIRGTWSQTIWVKDLPAAFANGENRLNGKVVDYAKGFQGQPEVFTVRGTDTVNLPVIGSYHNSEKGEAKGETSGETKGGTRGETGSESQGENQENNGENNDAANNDAAENNNAAENGPSQVAANEPQEYVESVHEPEGDERFPKVDYPTADGENVKEIAPEAQALETVVYRGETFDIYGEDVLDDVAAGGELRRAVGVRLHGGTLLLAHAGLGNTRHA